MAKENVKTGSDRREPIAIFRLSFRIQPPNETVRLIYCTSCLDSVVANNITGSDSANYRVGVDF